MASKWRIISPEEKMPRLVADLRAQSDELTAIFVTIIKRAREGGSQKSE